MRPRVKSALLWGLVGALSFLALNNTYSFLVAETVSFPVAVVIAALVGIVSGVSTYHGEGWWLKRKENV